MRRRSAWFEAARSAAAVPGFVAVVFAACQSGELTGVGTSPAPRPPVAPVVPETLSLQGLGSVTNRFTADVWVRGSYAYTTTWGYRGAFNTPGNALLVWDITGEEPRLLDSVIVDGVINLGDVQVSDDGRILVVPTEVLPGTLEIFDLSNPAQPTRLATFTSPLITRGVHTATLATVNGTLYAFLAVNRAQDLLSMLMVVDLSTPSAPRQVLALPMGNPFLHDVFVRDGLLFTAMWDDGLGIWDIGGGGRGGSVTNPVPITSVATVGGNVHNIWFYHDGQTGERRYAFVGEEGPMAVGASSSGDVHVVDLSNMSRPREVAFFTVPNAGAHNFWVDENRGVLYAAFYNGGVRAIDVRGDLGTCEPPVRVSDGRCDLGRAERELSQGLVGMGFPVYVWGVHGNGTHVFASDMLNGLWKLDAIVR